MSNRISIFQSLRNAISKSLLLILGISLLTYTIVRAASGDLDPTFSGDGKLTLDIGVWNERARAVTIQPDGKIIAVGKHYISYEWGGGESDILMVRLTSNGTLDTSFSGDGKLTTDFGEYEMASDVAIQSDGKIVVAGQTCNHRGTCDLALIRYNTNGSPDTAFGNNGIVIVDFGGGDNGIVGLAIQPDGKIVVAGYMQNSGYYDFAVHRFNPNGTPDTTFSGDGMLNTGFGSGRVDVSYDLKIRSGKIVVAGATCDSNEENCNFALARYTANGALDTTFSTDGKLITDFGGDDRGTAIVIQSNGKIVVAGNSGKPANSSIALARYNSNGSLDTTFSGDGKVTTNFTPGFQADAWDLVIQTDGRIVVIGSTGNKGGRDFALVRYMSNGSLDTTFGVGGKLTTDFGGEDEVGMALAIQENGRIIAAGWTFDGGDKDFALARYMP